METLMGATHRLADARLRKIFAQQDPSAFSRTCRLSIRLNRKQASDKSPFAMAWLDLAGREAPHPPLLYTQDQESFVSSHLRGVL